MGDKKLNSVEAATTVDNIYGNKGGADVQIPLAQAASVLADRFSRGAWDGNVDEILTLGFWRVRGTTSSGDLPFTSWFILLSIPIQADICVQLALPPSSSSTLKIRISGSGTWSSWSTFTGA